MWLMNRRRSGSRDISTTPHASSRPRRLSAEALAASAAHLPLSSAAGGRAAGVERGRRVAWERCMAELALDLGDMELATCHALKVQRA